MHQQPIAVKPLVRPFVKGYHSHIAAIPKIDTAGFALLTVLSNHRDKMNLAWPSQERLSGLTGLCAKSVAKYAVELDDAGLIEIGKARSTQTGLPRNTYSLPQLGSRWVSLHTDIIDLLPILGHVAFGIYSVLARYAHRETLIAYPSDTKLAKELGISERTLNRHIDQVYDHGIVQRKTIEWSGADREVYEVLGLRQIGDKNGDRSPDKYSERSDDKSSVYLKLESRTLVKTLSKSESKSKSVLNTPPAREAGEADSNPEKNAPLATASREAQKQWTDLERDLADLETARNAALVTASRAASKPGTESESEPKIPERDSDPDQTIDRVLSAPRTKQLAAMSATARALAIVADDDIDELDFLPVMDPWDGWEDDISTKSSVVPGTNNPVIFQSSPIANPSQDVRSSATTGDSLQSATEGKEKTVGHEGERQKSQPLEADLLMTEAQAWWEDLSDTLQTQVRTAIINREATFDPAGAAFMMTPAILSRVCEIGFTATFRLVSADPGVTPVVVSAFDETPDDIRARIRQRCIDLAAATAVYDADLKAAAERIAAVDHEVLADHPEAEAVVAYQLPSGDAFVVPITSAGYGWSQVVKRKDTARLPFNLVLENDPGGNVDAVFIRQVTAPPAVFSMSSAPLPELPVSSFVAVGDVLQDLDGGMKSDADQDPAPPSGGCAPPGHARRCYSRLAS